MTHRSPLAVFAIFAFFSTNAFAQKDVRVEDYDKAIKDLQKVQGSLNLYYGKRSVYLELPESKLGKLFHMQVSFATALDSAFMHAGMPIGGEEVETYRFDKNEESVWLVRPTIARRWDPSDPFALASSRAFPEAILGSYRIEQTNPEKKLLLVNVTQMFYGDLVRLPEQIGQMLGGPYMLDREKTTVDKVKGFPENTVVTMKMHFMSPRGSNSDSNPLAALLGLASYDTLEDSRSAPVKVDFNLWFRKDTGYKPRLADPRIGYFTEDFFSVEKFLNTDRTERYINRWQIEKKDTKAPVSEPVKPIIWTIDPSIPKIYRPAVKEGILRWNKAFDALGYKNAIQVVDAPANDPDYDHADGRRNVVRMMIGDSAPFGAISLFRLDPLSGQILNASITIDANVVRDVMMEQVRAQAGFTGSKADPRALLTRGSNEDIFATNQELLANELVKRASKFGWNMNPCLNATDMSQQATLAWQSLQSVSNINISKEEFVKKFIADMVCHEAGHCLGLRHNFAGSTQLTTAQLADDGVTSKLGISSSVMDYTPINAQAVLKGGGNFFSTTIGTYDKWAVDYGYRTIDAASPLGEKFVLSSIAAQSGLPGHAYASDEDASADWNPYAVRFDCASDPVNFADRSIAMIERAKGYASVNLPKPGESYSRRTAILLASLSRLSRESRNIERFIGGVKNNRNFKGDLGEKPTLQPVDVATQRQARDIILREFLAPTALQFSPDVVSHFTMDENGMQWNAPLMGTVSGLQIRMLALLLGASTTDRIVENQFKVKSGGYSIQEHYQSIVDSVFNEIGNSQSVRPLRRDLQKWLIDGLITQASASSQTISNDVRLVAGSQVLRMQSRIDSQLKNAKNLDSITVLHLKDLREAINRYVRRNSGLSR